MAPDATLGLAIAAVGPLMTAAAATHADGLLGHPFTSLAYLDDEVLPRIEGALDDADLRRRCVIPR